MRTNLVQTCNTSANRINLNRITMRVALIGLFISLGIGNAWAGDSGSTTYYAKVTVSVSTGAGTVYVNKESPATSGNKSDNSTGNSISNNGTTQDMTFYVDAVPANGYYFGSWTHYGYKSNNDAPATNNPSGQGTVSGKDDSNNPQNATSKANFTAITVSSVGTPSPASFSLTDLTINYAGSVAFTLNHVPTHGSDDLSPATMADATGNPFALGSYSVSSSSTTVTVPYTYTPKSTYTLNRATNSVKINLKGLTESTGKTSAAITATVPNITIATGTTEKLYTQPSTTVSGVATFDVAYADVIGDFQTPTFSTTVGGTWALNGSPTISTVDYTTGRATVTVPYKFTPDNSESDCSATLTLQAQTSIGGASNTCALTAEVSIPDSHNDAKIGDTKYETFEAALTAAASMNDATVTLLRDVTRTTSATADQGYTSSRPATSKYTISKSVTIDFNSYKINATMPASQTSLFEVASGATLILTDTKNGGGITVNTPSTNANSSIRVAQGLLKIEKGDIVLNNTTTSGGSAANFTAGVSLAASAQTAQGRPTAMLQMTGGSVSATRAGGSYVYGVLCQGTGSNASAADLRGGSISATNTTGSYAYGVSLAGESPVTGITVNATATSYAYAISVPAGATTVIEGGTYTATATGTNARALHTLGTTRVSGNPTFTANATTSNATAVDVAGGVLTLSNGSYSATTASTAYGVHLSATNAAATIAGGTYNAIATTSTAIGAYLQQAGNSITTTGGTFTASSKNYVYGVKADNTNSTITAQNTTFRGQSEADGAINSFGGRTVGTATFTDCTLEGNTKSAAYGLVIGNGTTTISGGTIRAISEGATAIGLYPKDNATAKMNVSGVSITATGTTGVAGVKVERGEATLDGITINATGTSAARSVWVNYSSSKATITNSSFNTTGGVGIYNQGTLDINSTTVVASTYALYLNASTATRVSSGYFKGTTNALGVEGTINANNNQFTGGFYNTNNALAARCVSGYQVFSVPSTDAEYSAGYVYTIGTPARPGYSVCAIYNGNTKQAEYKTIAEALQAVTSSRTIVITADCTLPAGDYVLPSGATLLVPKNASQVAANGTSTSNRAGIDDTGTTRSAYKTLTFASGAHLVSNGIIETGASIYGNGQNGNPCAGQVHNTYGRIIMQEGSLLELESGAILYSWGYITGKGIIDAKNGSTTLEDFQIGDWRGGSITSNMNGNDQHVMMITQYFIQNIECPIIYRPGSAAKAATLVIMKIFSSNYYGTNDINLVGNSTSKSLFLMDEKDSNPDTWVMKSYNPANDRITWTVNSGASIGKLTLTITVSVKSEDYTLPMANNMSIICNYGNIALTQDMVFLPGAELVVKKECNATASGAKIYFYDKDDWSGTMYYANYSPSWTNTTTNPRISDANRNKDAKFLVQGEFRFTGAGGLFTTNGGADICSTNTDAGKIVFGSAAPANQKLYYAAVGSATTTTYKDAYTAQLHNGIASPAYESTVGTTAGQVWGYHDNRWWKYNHEGCLYEEVETGKAMAYPSSFVEVEANANDEAYHSVADPSKYMIYSTAGINNTSCVWWNADPREEGHYMVTNPNTQYTNAYFYYDTEVNFWKPRTYTITWNNGATLIGYNTYSRNVKPKYTGKVYAAANATSYTFKANPTKTATAAANYFWDGWVTQQSDETSETCRVYSNDDMPKATGNTTYYAHFKAVKKQYTITFLNEDGTKREERTMYYGDKPECSDLPTKVSSDEYDYTLSWTPALPATVTASATYRATFTPSARKYTITFVNYNGDMLSQQDIAYGTQPIVPSVPTRQNDGFYSYDFAGWTASSDASVTYPDDNIPNVSGAETYTATFTTTDWTPEYTIIFKDAVENGGKVLQTQHIRLGNTLNDPSATLLASGKLQKAEDAGHTYVFDAWAPTLVTSPTASATYTATYRVATTKQYAITFKDYDGVVLKAATLTNYGATPTAPTAPSRTNTDEWDYTFNGWSPAVSAVSGEQTYIATYTATKRKYDITFKDGDGNTLKTIQVDYGTVPAYDVTWGNPTKTATAQYSYLWNNGWFPVLRAVTGNMTYTAQFSSTPRTYTVTLNVNGGTINAGDVTEYTYGTGATLPTNVTKDGHEFGGWFDNDGLTGDAVTSISNTATGNKEYWAKWTEKSYAVTFNNGGHGTVAVAGATVANGATASVNHFTTKSLEATASTGYTFAGWTTTGSVTLGSTSAASTTIKTTAAGGTVTATWTPISYTITYNNLEGASNSNPANYNIESANITLVDPGSRAGYDFVGWYTNEELTTPAGTPAIATGSTGAKTFWAKWTSAESGFWLDIVDVNNSTNKLTINTNSWASAGWPYTINDDVYEKNDREADRTLIIPYTGEVGATFAITVTNKNSVIVSKHNYIIPAEIKADANLGNQEMLYVKAGATLTVNANKTVKNIYVAPGAKMVVNNDITLTADTVFLRTTPWASAELELDGTISGQVCYTRIIKKKDQYYQFGIPMPCAIDDVRLSDGSTPVYGNGWLLRSYSEQHRAQYGSGADIDNWVTLTNEGSDVNKTIQGCVGYEMFSNSGYYREYYFPVAHTGLSDRVAVIRTTEATVGAAQEGWNIIVSPLMRTYTQSPAPEGATLSWLQEDGSYWQLPVTEIKPAIPFSYQATQTGYIVFDSKISLPAPQRRVAAAEEYKQIQWLQLDLAGAEGQKDETSIYAHPTRYEQTYQIGIDVAKQSLTATRALIYSSHAYGEMAFVGVPDSILEQGVALTVYSPKAQELTISMRKNDWLNRMAFVWLIDQATGAQIDLLESDYSFNAEAGTTAGRFILMGAFFAPQITTDNGNVQSDDEHIKAKKFIYNDKMYIQINGVIYDATGKLVK